MIPFPQQERQVFFTNSWFPPVAYFHSLPILAKTVRIRPMKIRSITCFIDPSFPLDAQVLETAGMFLRIAEPAFIIAGYEVQSCRLATVPFTRLLPDQKLAELAQLAQELETTTAELG